MSHFYIKNMNKRIILVGPTASGKNYIREKFREKGYKIDVSYTTRQPRKGEAEGIDYQFISTTKFVDMIANCEFYEHVQYGDCYYGTGQFEWDMCEIFIMETDGVSHIAPEDRKDCLVIYVNTPFDVRIRRMRERGWDGQKILERTKIDIEKFHNFKDYDLEISSEQNS